MERVTGKSLSAGLVGSITNQAITNKPRKFQAPGRAGNCCRGGFGEFRKQFAVESLRKLHIARGLFPEAPGFGSLAILYAGRIVQVERRGETGIETMSPRYVRNIPEPWHAAQRVLEGIPSRFNRSRHVHSAGLGEISTWQHHDG